ncbi:MAG: outer membrane protein assembly factor BamC [Burkholderiales bacterium]|nr:outer membrane protein assembly factor BamC [Burkholderiales bacterium]
MARRAQAARPSGWRACLLACAALAALAGCKSNTSLLQGPQIDYKSAGQLPPLEVPPDLTAPRRDDRYVVPETGKGTTTLSSYQSGQRQVKARGDTEVLPSAENMRVEGRGNERWLVVSNQTPEQLWPIVKDFWQENGFLIRKATPEAGVMETDWAENRAKLPQDIIRSTLGSLLDQIYSTSERDKFRTRLERTPDRAGTEIYITHRGMEEVYVDTARSSTKWQPRDTDHTLEAEFLRRLMVRLGAQEEKAKLLVASSTQQPERAALKKTATGVEVLEVFEPFDRTWRRVGLALDRVGFTVEDRDRTKGLYFVRYADPEAEMDRKDKEKPGLLDKLAFWKSSTPEVKAEQYRVSVEQQSASSEVRVLGKDGQAETTGTAHRILSLLHAELK